ncbi:MAG: restriction endonuclease subunit S [Pedococcus sp.]
MKVHARWRLQPLASLVDILDSRRVPVKASDRTALDGSVPYYGATGQAGTIDRPLFNEALVLLGEDGAPFFDPTKSKAYLIDGPAWVNNHAHVLRTRDILDRRFLKYYLDVFDYRGFANGTTRLKLTQGAMRTIPVPLPDISEQRLIVEIVENHLSRLDSTCRDLRKAQGHLTALRSSVLHLRMVGPASRLGDLRLDADYGTSTKCAYDGSGVPVLRIPNLRAGAIDTADLKFAFDTAANLSRSMVTEGDVLIVRTNGSKALIGRSAVVSGGVKAAFASYLIRYRVDPGLLLPEWLQLSLESPLVRAEIERLAASSAGQHNLSLSKLDGLVIPCPDLVVQGDVLSEIRDVDRQIQRTGKSLEAALMRGAALRRGVLTAAFEGKLTGRQSDEEAIEELADDER